MGVDRIAGWVELEDGEQHVRLDHLAAFLLRAREGRHARDLAEIDDQSLIAGRVDVQLDRDVQGGILRIVDPTTMRVIPELDPDVPKRALVKINDLHEYLRPRGYRICFVEPQSEVFSLEALAEESASYEYPHREGEDELLQILRASAVATVLPWLESLVEEGDLETPLNERSRIFALELLGQLVQTEEAGYFTLSVDSSEEQDKRAALKSKRQASGLWTVREAAEVLAHAYKREGPAVLSRLQAAYTAGELIVWDPATVLPLVDRAPLDTAVHLVKAEALDLLLKGWGVDQAFSDCLPSRIQAERGPPVIAAPARRVTAPERHATSILHAICKELALDPLRLPGDPKNPRQNKTKRQVKALVVGDRKPLSKDVFKRTWQYMLDNDMLAYSG